MFVVKLNYLLPEEDIRPFLQAHRDYWDFYFQEGVLLAKGPMVSSKGMVLILLGNEEPLLEKILKKDPLYLAKVSEFDMIQFSATTCVKELKTLIINAPEGRTENVNF